MDRLLDLGLRDRWIYEVLVSTFRDGAPHAAPIGLWCEGAGELFMDLYDGSQTLTNIVESGALVANFPADVALLFAALRAPGELAFAAARCVHAPLVLGCPAAAELTVSSVCPSGDKVRIAATVECLHGDAAPHLINRAEGLLLESLILATRLEHMEASVVLATLTENHRVVSRVAPESDHERMRAALLGDLRPAS